MLRSSLVTPNVELSKVEAINQKRTLAFINRWVLHTVGFLNQFSAVCEERLISLDTKLRQADQSLAILEAKLSSVPDLEGVSAPATELVKPSDSRDSSAATEPSSLHNQALPGTLTVEDGASHSKEFEDTHKEEHEDLPSSGPAANPVNKDPRFASFFKMLAVGVPLPAVQIKMRNEGLDPTILNDPNAPAPPITDDHTEGLDNSDSSSVSSFSE